MTNIEILRTYNDWRRDRTGNRTLEDFGITPRMIGEALDAVIKDAERYQWLRAYAHVALMDYEMTDLFSYNDEIIDKKVDELRSTDAAMAKESRQ
jgi:hypothetical protein